MNDYEDKKESWVQRNIKPYFVQVGVLTWKNFLLSSRNLRSTLGQLLSPIAIVIILIVLQLVTNMITRRTDEHPKVNPIGNTLSNCTAGKNGKCHPLLYAPKGIPWVDKLVRRIANDSGLDFNSFLGFGDGKPKGIEDFFKDNSTMTDYILKNQNVSQNAIIFLSPYINESYHGEDLPNELGYWLFYNETAPIEDTSRVMVTLDKHITSLRANGTSTNITVDYRPFPRTLYRFSILDISSLMGGNLFFIPPMIIFFVVLVDIVVEKENRLRLGMRMMGLGNSSYWMSCLIQGFLFVLLSTLILFLSGFAARFSFFTRSNFFSIFLLFSLFGFSMISVAMFLSTLIKKSGTAQTVGYAIILAGFVFQSILTSSWGFLIDLLWMDTVPPWVVAIRVILHFYPPFNLAKAFSDIAALSSVTFSPSDGRLVEGPGFKWSDMYIKRCFKFGNNSFCVPEPNQSYLILIGNSVLFLILTWYLDNVLSGDHGSPKPFYFLFTPEYWGLRKPKPKMPIVRSDDSDEDYDSDVLEEKNAALNESIHLNRENHLINVRNLTKVYRKYLCCSSKKDQKAVNNISFNIEDGEIFCLLGHNGAGKTTTINILTGLYKPTSGTANICGYDIVENIEAVQKKFGVCPQHDVLWEDLTAREHLKLFSYVKNIPSNLIEQEVQEKLEMVGLTKVADNVTKSYSGGMKRRLSIAIANIGNPKIVFLDEPTSGLDPMNKSAIWHMIQKIKEDKAIILTTHSMEEAEVLSNRIGIMAFGKIRAIGDPLHLKAKYGEGYRINVVININLSQAFTEKVKSMWNEVTIMENSGSISINVPKSNKDLVPQIVKFLEENKDVKEWGVSDSTLEGVFLTVTKKHNFVYDDIEEIDSNNSDDELIDMEDEEQHLLPNTKKDIKSYPFRALIRKNLSLQRRQYFDNICQISIPVFVILILLLLKIIIKSQIDTDDQVNFVPGIPFTLNFHGAFFNDTWEDPSDPNVFHDNVLPYEIVNRYKDIISRLPEVYNKMKTGKEVSNLEINVQQISEPEPQESEPQEPEPQEPEPQEPVNPYPSNNNCYTLILFTDSESPEKAGYVDKYGNKSGMFREILQYRCYIYDEKDVHELNMPYFESRNSTIEIENEIVKYIKIYNNHTNREIETPPLSYLLPDGHVNIHYLNSSDLSIHYSVSANEHLTRAFHRRNDFTRTRSGKLYPHYGYFQLVSIINRAFSVFSLLKKGIESSPLSHLLNVIFVQTMPELKPFDIWIMIELFGTILYPMGLTIQLPLYLYLLTLEKYEKLKQMMLSHGLKSWHYHFTNYLFFFVIYLLVAGAFWIAGFASGSRVFLHTHWSVMFTVLFGWGLCLISLAFFLSSIVNTPRVATILGYSVALFGSMIASGVSLFLYGPLPISLETHFPTWLYIWPQFTLSRAIYLMNDNCALKNECYGSLFKVSWSNELPKAVVGLYLASIIYFILFLYLDAVLPRQYGVPKHPLFMFEKCLNRKKNMKTISAEELEIITSQEDDEVRKERLKVENSMYDPFVPLVLSNLRKEYNDGNVAVKSLSLVTEEGECFGLLGENGAGKTTTISMLTGLFKPTSGWATICGYSIITDIDKIHLLMGLCPQFDILWEDLTVKEHILFYARVKGIPPKEENEHANKILHEVGLYDSRNKLAKKLSGGMKRRLSIAISLVGNSKIVFMDEPTTGLDPASRLQVWKIIQRAKKNRAIILTTHAMDEAELLCTRVGIMAKGIMRCIGESQVLKNKIGDGYRLFLNFMQDCEDESEQFVKSICKDAVVVERYKQTLVFNISKDINVSEVFEKMESDYKNHGISDWAISQISLTDVFRKVILASKSEEQNNIDLLIE